MNTRTLPALCCLLAAALVAGANDWPQWRGPERNEISREKGLLKSWSADGPKLLWTYTEAGNGYSGPAVVGDRLYTMGIENGKDAVIALDVANGKKVWSGAVGGAFNNPYGDGPRCTPTVDGDVLYALGGGGDLVCLTVADGKKRWGINLKRDLSGQMMSGWGYAESPLVDGDRLICSPGGKRGTLAALDKKTGQVIWRSEGLTDLAAYSSIIVAEVGNVRTYVQMTREGVVGVAARDGKFLWRSSIGANRTAVIPTPVYADGTVYATSGYGSGCGLLKLTPDGAGGIKAAEVYRNKNMTNQHGGVILVDGTLYGYSDSNGWMGQDFKTGEIVWPKADRRKLGKGSQTFADGMLYCYAESDGTVVLIDASPKGWQEHGRFKIPKQSEIRSRRGKHWTHPVVANGRLYLRDQDLIFCFDVKAGGQ